MIYKGHTKCLLVYPHRTPHDVEPDELRFCLDLAVEMRQRVVEQLQAIAPKEFQKVRRGFESAER